MKKKLLFAAALLASVLSGGYTWAQEDVTSKYLSNPSFELSAADTPLEAEIIAKNSTPTIYGWTLAGVGTSFSNTEVRKKDSTSDNTSQFGTSNPSDGDFSLFYRNGWNNTGTSVTITSNELAELPAGYYVLSVDYKQHYSYDNQQNSNTHVSIALNNGGESLTSAQSGPASATSGGNNNNYFTETDWSTLSASLSLDEPLATGSTVVITLNAAGQRRSDFYIDNVRISYLSLIDGAKLELEKVIEAASTITEARVNVGSEAFQIPASAVSALETAITTAHGVYDNAEASVEEVEKATAALKAAVEAYTNVALNAPEDGQLYNVINVSDDYAGNNNALTFKSSATNANVVQNNPAMGWTENAGSIYPQGVEFVTFDGAGLNEYKLKYTRADNKVIYVCTGNGYEGNGRTDQIRPTENKEKALVIRVDVTNKEGVWKLYNTEAKAYIGANKTQTTPDLGFYTSESYFSDVKIQEAVEYTAEVEIAGGKYSTIIVPFDTEIDADVYSVSEDDVEGNVLKLQPVEGGIKANTPYIVYAEKAIENLSGIGAAYTDKSTFTAGLLTGTYATNQTVAKGNYVLQTNDENEQGFYVVNDDNFSHTQYRAYLTKPAGGDVKAAYYFDFAGDATAIEAMPEVAEGAKVFYNLAGQRVASPTKGIYIVNGQKVLVK